MGKMKGLVTTGKRPLKKKPPLLKVQLNKKLDGDWIAKKVAPKCECGTWTTFGKDVPKTAHSTWCDVYKG